MNLNADKGPNLKVPMKVKVVKNQNNNKWEIMFPFKVLFEEDGVFSKLDTIMDLINKKRDLLLSTVNRRKPSVSGVVKMYKAGEIMYKTREEIKSRFNVDITNIVDIFSEIIEIDKRNINYMILLYLSVDKKNLDERISWTVYRYAISLKDKTKINVIIKMYREGNLKSSTDVRRFVHSINQGEIKL
jgi:hypothetical protein